MAAASKMEQMLLPHLDAAYNLARWMMKTDQDAKDVVQESFLRAFKSFGTWSGEGDARPWLLQIVRNCCYTSLRRHQNSQDTLEYDDEVHGNQVPAEDPLTLLLTKVDQSVVRGALESLPASSREILILSELEDLSYKEISEVTGLAMGTVMSRLSRARARLKELMQKKEGSR